jgi:hypothetical protein
MQVVERLSSLLEPASQLPVLNWWEVFLHLFEEVCAAVFDLHCTEFDTLVAWEAIKLVGTYNVRVLISLKALIFCPKILTSFQVAATVMLNTLQNNACIVSTLSLNYATVNFSACSLSYKFKLYAILHWWKYFSLVRRHIYFFSSFFYFGSLFLFLSFFKFLFL